MTEEFLIKAYDENNPTEILQRYQEVHAMKTKISKVEDKLKEQLKIKMKEFNWDNYYDDDTDISVKIIKQQRENVNTEELKKVLKSMDYAKVVRTITFEKMMIITPELRKKVSKYVTKG